MGYRFGSPPYRYGYFVCYATHNTGAALPKNESSNFGGGLNGPFWAPKVAKKR